MFRILSIVGAFVLGALTWAMIAPSPSVHESVVVEGVDVRSSLAGAIGAPLPPEERTVGIPPDTATAVQSAPGAGQRRALSRVLRELEKNPPEIDETGADEETTHAIADGLRAAFADQGDNP